MSHSNGVGGAPAILVEGLTKSFGEVHALRGIDLSVPRGTVLGVLGPNGAGKTTAVRILTTLLLPDGGRALVEGHDVVREAASVRRSIGLAGQSAAIQEELTGRENLEIIGRLYHLSRPRTRSRATELLEQFGLSDAAERADGIVVIDHGLVIAAGRAEELKGRVGGDVVEFTVPDRSRISDAAAAIARIGESEPLADKETGVVSIRVGSRGSDALIEAVRALDAVEVEVRDLALRRPSLDDVFLALTGHAAEEEEPGRRRRGRRAGRQGKDAER